MIGSKIMANKESIQWKDIVGVDMQNYGYTCVLTKGDTTFHFNGAISNFIELIRVWLGSILHGTPISGNSNSPEKQPSILPTIFFQIIQERTCTETQSQRLAFCKSDLKGRGFVVFLCSISPLIGAVDCGVWNPFLLPTVESKLIEYGILANFLKGMNWYFFFFFLCFLKGPNSIF